MQKTQKTAKDSETAAEQNCLDKKERKREQKALRKNMIWLNLLANPSNTKLQSIACEGVTLNDKDDDDEKEKEGDKRDNKEGEDDDANKSKDQQKKRNGPDRE